MSSGAGDLSDSMSVGEIAKSRFRKKKSRVRRPSFFEVFLCRIVANGITISMFVFQSKVKVRRASISEPSDTDYEPRTLSSANGLLL